MDVLLYINFYRLTSFPKILSHSKHIYRFQMDFVFEVLHSELTKYNLENSRDKKEECLTNIECIGYTTGYRLIERLTMDISRFKDELDTIKYICTEFWTIVHKKPIDNLRTNHQGIYVLQDNNFRIISSFSNDKQYLNVVPRYLAYTCGLIRGSLANLGIKSVVTAEVQTMPLCKFHVQIPRL